MENITADVKRRIGGARNDQEQGRARRAAIGEIEKASKHQPGSFVAVFPENAVRLSSAGFGTGKPVRGERSGCAGCTAGRRYHCSAPVL